MRQRDTEKGKREIETEQIFFLEEPVPSQRGQLAAVS